MQYFDTLASLCSWVDLFEHYLIASQEYCFYLVIYLFLLQRGVYEQWNSAFLSIGSDHTRFKCCFFL